MMARSVADLQSPVVPQADRGQADRQADRAQTDRAPNWSSASDVMWRLH